MSQDRLRVSIHVHPGSRRPGVGGSRGEALIVRVAQRAIDGAANEGVLRALAKAFELARDDVRFLGRTRARDKVVELRGDVAALTARRDQLRQTAV